MTILTRLHTQDLQGKVNAGQRYVSITPIIGIFQYITIVSLKVNKHVLCDPLAVIPKEKKLT